MFVVKTQIIENYGAHTTDGRYADGQARWKFKGGNEFLVSNVDSLADAMAFVAAAFTENHLDYKEFPTAVMTEQDWIDQLPDDADYRDFLKSQIYQVSPRTGKRAVKGYPQDFEEAA